MKQLFRVCVTVMMVIVSLQCFASDSTVVFSYSKTRLNDEEVLLTIKATIAPGVKLYALQRSPTDAVFSSLHFDSVSQKYLSGKLVETGNRQTTKDTSLQTQAAYFTDSAIWQQKITVAVTDSIVLKGTIDYLCQKDGQYIPGNEKFKSFIQPDATTTTTTNNSISDIGSKSLWWIFFAAFAGGLLALLTPCVYSMIPVTVSFFTKRSNSKVEGIRNALYYSSSIIVIFTLLGFLITVVFGPAALNNLATNWIANLFFFVLFVLFGISFLGAFDIALPSSWTNKSDSKAGTNNFVGIFFMALTLVLVSFSCTGPIIGNLLVLAAKGDYFGPLVGMFGFSLALALPFALFAFFPSKLHILGKAGGWLNAVKVTLGFLELALALKFLSNADLSKGWRLLDREIFLSLWIVIFFLLGVYLLGKLKFHHDDELPKNDFGLPYLSVTRLFFAIAAFAFATYMVPGLFGAPLKGISAFVPPMGTQDFNIATSKNNPATEKNATTIDHLHPVKYVERMKIYEPEIVTKYRLEVYYDYDEAFAAARQLHKPLMLDFTGINCVNCRKMEAEVWSDPEVMKRLKNDFVIVSLYVDATNVDLPEGEQYYSKALDKKVETLGDKNADMQVTQYGANSQPYYFFVDGNEKKLADEGYGYDSDVEKFVHHLDNVLKAYDQEKP